MKNKVRVRIGILFTALLFSFTLIINTAVPVYAGNKVVEPLDFTAETASSTGPGWAWDAQSKTLTLNGLEMELFNCFDSYAAGITVPDGTKIVLSSNKENRITIRNYSDAEGTGDAIRSTGDLSFVSDDGNSALGKLYISINDGTNGIHSIGGDISIYSCSISSDEGTGEDAGCFIFADSDDNEGLDDTSSITISESLIFSDGFGTELKTSKNGGIDIQRSLMVMTSSGRIADVGTKGLDVSGSYLTFNSHCDENGEAVLTSGPVNVYSSLFYVNKEETDGAGIRMLEPSSDAFNNNHFSFDGAGSEIDIRGGAGAVIVEDSTTGDTAPVFSFGYLTPDTGGELKNVSKTVQGTQTYYWSFAADTLELDNESLTGASQRIFLIETAYEIPGSSAGQLSYTDLNMKITSALMAGRQSNAKTVTIDLYSDYCFDESIESDHDYYSGIVIDYGYEGFDDYTDPTGITTDMEENNQFVNYPQVIIEGNGHTIDGNNESRIFQVSGKTRVIFHNLVLKNGHAQSERYHNNDHDVGGAVTVKDFSKVLFDKCSFISNHAEQNGLGGAIFVYRNSTLIINECVFDDSYAQDAGNILGVLDGNVITVFYSNITEEDIFNDKDDMGLLAPIALITTTEPAFSVSDHTEGTNADITITQPENFNGLADITIGDKTIKDVKFDSTGKASVDLGLAPGTYSLDLETHIFEYDKDIGKNIHYMYSPASAKSNSFTVTEKKKTSITASGVNTVFGVNKNIVATLKDEDGNSLKNTDVTVTLNGNSKVYKTDSNGRISVSTEGLFPNTYSAQISFGGNSDYEKSSAAVTVEIKKATPVITAKAKTFKVKTKTKKYKVTLKDNKNQPLANANMSLKVKGKTYYAKTNANGIATFKIKKLKKKGKFKAVIKVVNYEDGRGYNVVGKTVKIKVKK